MEIDLSTTWPMRQALERCFPKGRRHIALPTVHQWIQQGVFHPVHQSGKSGPRGNRLDVADLVTISIMSQLFGIGVRFKAFTGGKHQRHFGGSPGAGIITNSHGTSRVVLDYGGLKEEDVERVKREVETLHRPIQAYLESTRFQCFARIEVDFGQRITHVVNFECADPRTRIRPQDFDYSMELIGFVYAEAHYRYIMNCMGD